MLDCSNSNKRPEWKVCCENEVQFFVQCICNEFWRALHLRRHVVEAFIRRRDHPDARAPARKSRRRGMRNRRVAFHRVLFWSVIAGYFFKFICFSSNCFFFILLGGLYSLVRTSIDLKTEIKHELCTSLAHIDASRIVSAPKSLFAVISKSGKLHLWLDLNFFH